MKKLLVCLLVLVMLATAFVAVACDPEEEPPAPTEVTKEMVTTAASMIREMYRTSPTITTKTYTLISQVRIVAKGAVPITWSVQLEGENMPDYIIKVAAEKDSEGMTVIEIIDKCPANLNYTLTATMTDKDGGSQSVSFERTIPAYIWGDFDRATEPADGTYKYGMYQVNLGGKLLYAKAEMNGQYLASTDNVAEAADLTVAKTADNQYTLKIGDKYLEVEDINTDESKAGGSFRPKLVDAPTEGNRWGWNDEAQVFEWTITKNFATETTEPNVLYLGTYNTFDTFSLSDTFRITGNSAGAVEVSQFPARLLKQGEALNYDDMGKAIHISSKLQLGIDSVEKADISVDLPATHSLYESSVIVWTTDNDAAVKIADGKASFVLQPEACNVTLTATITVGEASYAKDFVVALAPAPKGLFMIAPITEAAAGTYKMGVMQANLGEYRFVDGTQGSAERYHNIVTNPAMAADIVVAEAEGGYTLKIGGKFLNIKVVGTFVNALLEDTQAGVWVWDDTLKTFKVVISGQTEANAKLNGDYSLASRNTYTNVEARKLGAEDEFYVQLGKIAEADYQPVEVAYARAGIFKLAVVKHNTLYWATGENQGTSNYRYDLTTDSTKAGDIVVAAVDGGYTLKIGDKFLNIKVVGTYVNALLEDTPDGVWVWDDVYKTFKVVIAGQVEDNAKLNGEYTMSTGTSDTYYNFEAKLISANNRTLVKLVTPVLSIVEENIMTVPIAGTYKMSFYNVANDARYYLDGTMGTNNLNVIDDRKLAVDVALATLADNAGYTLKVGDKYLTLTQSGTYTNIVLGDEEFVWQWNDVAKTFTRTMGQEAASLDNTFYLGAYGDKTGLSVSKLKYIINDDGTAKTELGVSQYVMQLSVRGYNPIIVEEPPKAGEIVKYVDFTPANTIAADKKSCLDDAGNKLFPTSDKDLSATASNGTVWLPGMIKDTYWQFETSTLRHKETTVTFAQYGTKTGPRDFIISISSDGGNNWTTITTVRDKDGADIANDSGLYAVADKTANYSFVIPEAFDNQTNIIIRWTVASDTNIEGNVGIGGNARMGIITLTGTTL